MTGEGAAMARIDTVEELEAIYGEPGQASLVKELDRLIPEYRALIEAAPFVALATAGPEGLDCSPRGDLPGFVRILDDRTLLMPDRRGNNRADSLKNIVRDGRVGLLFVIPGSGTTLRVNGTAYVSADTELRAAFAMEGALPRTVTVIAIQSVYFQCARAIKRSRLWEEAAKVDPASLPTPGEILARTSAGDIDGKVYDGEWPGRAAKTMW